MEKDALLEIILRDLQEVETLTQSFKGKTEISKVFYRLARNKLHSILDEIDVLEEIAASATNTGQTPDTKEKKQIVPTPEKKNSPIPNPENTISSSAAAPKPIKEVIPIVDKPKLQSETMPEVTNISDSSSNPENKTQQTIQPDIPNVTTSAPNEDVVPSTQKTQPETQQNKNSDVNQPNPVPQNNGKVLGEKLGINKASFNEHIGKNQSDSRKKRSLTMPPIKDLKKALGINDRFFYQRELFGGNADLMNQTLDQLNQMNNLEDARNFLLANFHWDPEEEAVMRFLELVERRFS